MTYRSWAIFIILLIAAALWMVWSDGQIRREIRSSVVPVEEQQKALLLFEKQAECEAHTLCFDATVDGKAAADPVNAVQQCTAALANLDRVSVPDVFPATVKARLEDFKRLLRVDTVSSLEQAQETVAAQQVPPKYGFSASFRSHPTCDAYSVIDKVNRMYDVQRLMKGHYINCDVLQGL